MSGFSVFRGDELEFGPPSWRPEERLRTVVELSEASGLESSRANLWRYPPGAEGRRHRPLVQEEVFVVLEGELTFLLGEGRERHTLPPRSVVVVRPGTPLKLANEGGQEVLVFVYGAPADRSAELLEDA